jgi:Mg-chelatase subunit ChlI
VTAHRPVAAPFVEEPTVSLSESPTLNRRTVVTMLAVLAVTSACGYSDGSGDEPVRVRRDPPENEHQPDEDERENESGEDEGENERGENESEQDENERENEQDENEGENEPDEDEPDENGSDEGGDGESGEDEPEEPSGPGAGTCAENPGECEQGS